MAKRTESKQDPDMPSALRQLAGVGLITIAVCAAYFPSLNGGFILDDDLLLTANPLIKAADGLYRFWLTTEAYDYWPVANTSLWIEWRLWGMNPTGYHVTNLILHIVESCLIWSILRKLSIPGAFLAALLFAVHPVNVETVAWIVQRKSLLAMLFFLLSILGYLQAETEPPTPSHLSSSATDRWYWLSLLAFVLAMLSKGSVAVLPVLLLGIVWWLRPLRKRDLLRTAPFFLVAVVLVLVNVWFQTHGTKTEFRAASFAERLLGAGAVVWFYLYKALVPVDLAFIYPQWHVHADQWPWRLPLLAAVAATCVLWWYRRSWSRPLLFAWGYFCVALLPVMGFTDVGFMQHSLVADHYQHTALIGIIALVAAGWGTWQQRAQGPARWLPNVVAVAVGGVLALLTWQQSKLYADAVTLYQATLEKNPASWLAHNNLSPLLFQAGRPQQAIEHLEQVLRLKPDYTEAHQNLGAVLSQVGRPREAIEHLELVLRLKPDAPDAHYNLGIALAMLGQLEEAIEHYQQTLRLQPDFAEAHSNLCPLLLQVGQRQEAIEHCEQALRLRPEYPEAHYNLGNALAEAGQRQEATAHFREAVRLKPDYPEAQYNLGKILFQAGQRQEALERYQQALRLKQDYPEAHNNLGALLFEMGRPQEAIEHYESALRLQPNFPEAHSNLGKALFQARRAREAIEHFQQALRLKPDSSDTHNDLGVALTDTGQLDEAIGHFEQGLRLKPDDRNIRSNLEEAVALKRKAADAGSK
jgi:tetratricopeptide (TPR) repeat protein